MPAMDVLVGVAYTARCLAALVYRQAGSRAVRGQAARPADDAGVADPRTICSKTADERRMRTVCRQSAKRNEFCGEVTEWLKVTVC